MDFVRKLVVLVALGLLANASDDNSWLYPTSPGPTDYFAPDLVFSLGSQPTLQWTTNISYGYDISLFHQYYFVPGGSAIIIGTVCSQSSQYVVTACSS